MPIEVKRVEGRDAGRVMLYALSTCVWCKKTKRLLAELGVAYEYIDVDGLSREERNEVEKEIKRWNPRASFPTIVLDDSRAITGFDEEKIRESLQS